MIVQQARLVGITAPIFADGSAYSPQLISLAGNAANGVILTSEFLPTDPRPNVQAFVKAYEDRYKVVPDGFAEGAYDALNILIWAVKQGGAARDGIFNALRTGKDIPSLHASARAEGRSGIRRIRIRDFQIISDSGPDFAGYDLGPTSPELQLGVLGSCLTHVFLIQAAQCEVPLESLDVEISAQIDPRAGQPGYENVPVYPHNISYTVHIDSPASKEDIAALHEAVERACPILNLLINPQQINGTLVHNTGDSATSEAAASTR